MSIGNFPESLSQGILVGILLVGILGVSIVVPPSRGTLRLLRPTPKAAHQYLLRSTRKDSVTQGFIYIYIYSVIYIYIYIYIVIDSTQ